MRVTLGFAATGLIALAVAVLVSVLTSEERTFLIGDSFGADTAVAWCITVAVVAFVGAYIGLMITRLRREEALGPVLFLVLALLPVGGLVLALSWSGVDRYTVGSTGGVTREQPGFLKGEQLYYDRDGIFLTLIDRGF